MQRVMCSLRRKILSGHWASASTSDIDMSSYNALDDMDLRFLDAYNSIRSELPVRILEGLRAHSGGLAGVRVRRSVGCLRA
jgi:hypothetical protein